MTRRSGRLCAAASAASHRHRSKWAGRRSPERGWDGRRIGFRFRTPTRRSTIVVCTFRRETECLPHVAEVRRNILSAHASSGSRRCRSPRCEPLTVHWLWRRARKGCGSTVWMISEMAVAPSGSQVIIAASANGCSTASMAPPPTESVSWPPIARHCPNGQIVKIQNSQAYRERNGGELSIA